MWRCTSYQLMLLQRPTFHYAETDAAFRGSHNLGNYLTDTGYHHRDGGWKSRTLWDLSLIYSFLYPYKVELKTITTTRDNGSQKIQNVINFDNDDLKENLFISYKKWKKRALTRPQNLHNLK